MCSFKLSFLFLSVSLSLFSTLGLANAADSQLELEDYTSIQTLLAKDTFLGVSDLAKKLSKEANTHHHQSLSASSLKLSHAQELAGARTEFMEVSKDMLPIFNAEKDSHYEVVYCPMKKARWVQKKGSIANPYYGSEMLECGVKDKL